MSKGFNSLVISPVPQHMHIWYNHTDTYYRDYVYGLWCLTSKSVGTSVTLVTVGQGRGTFRSRYPLVKDMCVFPTWKGWVNLSIWCVISDFLVVQRFLEVAHILHIFMMPMSTDTWRFFWGGCWATGSHYQPPLAQQFQGSCNLVALSEIFKFHLYFAIG